MALDEALTGQITPHQIDQAFLLAPAFPWESPLPFVPRYLARQMWPQGFKPFQPAAPPAPPAAQAPPGLPPPPQPRAVAPPPPPAPVTSTHRPVAERRGM